jgi:putative hemolysin
MVQASRAAGSLEADPDRLVERALDFAQLSAHHIMVPRTEMVSIPENISLAELSEIMNQHQHSRYPVYEDTSDNVVGLLWVKHLASALAASPGAELEVRGLIRQPMYVPETMRADRLLTEMKRHRSHEAVVIDEYGATAGLVTLRDIMDRLAGEVRDQAEVARPSVETLPDGSAMVDGLLLLSDVQTEVGMDFGETEYDTLGGYIFGKLGRRPKLGDSVDVDSRTLTVEELDGLRISRVRIAKQAEDPAPELARTEAVGS